MRPQSAVCESLSNIRPAISTPGQAPSSAQVAGESAPPPVASPVPLALSQPPHSVYRRDKDAASLPSTPLPPSPLPTCHMGLCFSAPADVDDLVGHGTLFSDARRSPAARRALTLANTPFHLAGGAPLPCVRRQSSCCVGRASPHPGGQRVQAQPSAAARRAGVPTALRRRRTTRRRPLLLPSLHLNSGRPGRTMAPGCAAASTLPRPEPTASSLSGCGRVCGVCRLRRLGLRPAVN